MRKNIFTYNHKKFAQAQTPKTPAKKPSAKPNFKDPVYINKILSNIDKKQAANQLIFLAIRSIFGDQKINELNNEKKYDQTVFSQDGNNKIIEFIFSLDSVPNIDKTKLSSIKTEIFPILQKKFADNLNTTGTTNQTQGMPGNTTVPIAPMLSPAQAAEMERPKITPEQANKYLSSILETLEKMSKDTTKPKEFTRRYSNEYNYIVDSLNIIKFDPKLSTNVEKYYQRFTDLGPIFNNLMHPTGYSVAGNSIFVTDWYTLGDQIIKDLQSKNWSSAKDKLTTFQNEFLNKNPKNTDISDVANKVNQVLDRANAGFGKTVRLR